MIPYGRQDITQADIDAVVGVLRSDFLTQGPVIPRFEEAVASRVGAKHAVAASSATAALHLACLAIGIGKGDTLWTVPNTFVASANCGLYCGASIDFVDIDSETYNVSIDALRAKLAKAKKSGRLPKVFVPVHFGGQATEQEAIWELAQEYGFRVIEDASHSVGAVRNGEPVGSCRWSDIAVLSFHPVKIITTGEGGMALTNDARLAERLAMFRTHGITRDSAKFTSATKEQRDAPWYYEQQLLGFNYRLTDLQAALGLSQLDRLVEYVKKRNALAARYDRLLADCPLQLPRVSAGNLSAFHIYVVRLPGAPDPARHRRILGDLRKRGIGVNLHYLPVHLQPYYRDLGFKPGQFPEAERHAISAITLPLYAALTEAAQDEVITALKELV